MGKLELRHLAAYLPYNVSVKWVTCNVNLKFIGLCTAEDYNNEIYCEFKDKSRTWSDLNTNEFKLILRNLSDLTKEIEINGEKFVPLLRLFNLERKELVIKEIYHNKNCFKSYTVGVKHHHKKHKDNICIASLNFGKGNLDVIRFDYVQTLLKWHFDIFDLIDTGLAIDMNTL